MIKVKLIERESNYSNNTYFILIVPCFICGADAEGRVAASKSVEEFSKNAALKWKDQIEKGQATLKCPECHRQQLKDNETNADRRRAEVLSQNKIVTNRTG
jgi:hypothetical protein